jgi:hypothetical protein
VSLISRVRAPWASESSRANGPAGGAGRAPDSLQESLRGFCGVHSSGKPANAPSNSPGVPGWPLGYKAGPTPLGSTLGIAHPAGKFAAQGRKVVVAINWNDWSPSIGTGGRHQLERLVVFNRNRWSPSRGARKPQPQTSASFCGTKGKGGLLEDPAPHKFLNLQSQFFVDLQRARSSSPDRTVPKSLSIVTPGRSAIS